MVAARDTTVPEVKGKVLVVDDEIVVRNFLAEALGRGGFTCHTAGDGEEAHELLNAGNYDVVVTDLRMPRRHGHALCVDLLERADRPLLVVLTGVGEPRLTRDLTTRGVDAVFAKPVDHSRLAAKVEELIGRRNALPQAARDTGGKDASGDASLPAEAVAEEEPPAANPGREQSPGSASIVTGKGVQIKHLAVVLLRSHERSQELAGKLASARMEAVAVRNSEDLYEQILRQRIDLLIIEDEQKGFLTGLELLERLRDQLVQPEALLLADADAAVQEKADLLGVDRVVGPQTDLEEIADSAKMLLAAQKTADVFVPPPARKLVEGDDIPPMPQLLVRLAAYMEMEMEEIPLEKLAEEISVDQKATTELLKLANSAGVGVRQKVNGVFDALKLLGPQQTILLILASATVRIQSNLLSEWSHPLRQWFQKRSILIASAASTCAGRLEKVSPDTAFVLGLLQDLGILILARRFGAGYRKVLQRLQQVGHTQLPLVEAQDFGVTHAAVSGALMQKWELSKSLVRPVLNHHESAADLSGSTAEAGFHRVMQIGEALANLVDLAHPARQQRLNDLLADYGSPKSADCRAALQDSVTKTAQLAEVFAVPPPDQETLEALVAKWPSLQ